MAKIRVGCVGIGAMGKLHYEIYKKHPNAVVVAIADADEAKLAGEWTKKPATPPNAPTPKPVDLSGIKKYKDADELIDDPEIDLVDVTTPTFLHFRYVMKALEAGKHVLCEMPLALTVQEADRIASTSDKAKGKFMVAQCIRFWPEYEYLAQIIRGKKYGRVKSALFKRRSTAPSYGWQNWLMNAKRSGGAVLDLHIHDADYISYIFGIPKKLESAGITGPSGGIDHIVTSYDFGKSMLVTSEGGWAFHGSYASEMAYTIIFDKATVEYSSNQSPTVKIYSSGGKVESPPIPDGSSYQAEIDYFLNCILKNQKPKTVTAADARNAVLLVRAEEKSARDHRNVAITI